MQARLQRQQAVSETRRALVLDAARAVFEEHGIEGANIREIARRAGYTPGAIYSYFESKEALYGALLAESLERLIGAVQAAQPQQADPAAFLKAKAQGWFAFYAAHPRELDLGFYLVHGLAPRGLTSDLNQRLNARLHEALAPCEQALLAIGFDAAVAERENTALFAHGVGLLLLQHTGRIRMFKQNATDLFDHYLDALLLRAPANRGGPSHAARRR
jgi:AcrR family transcriptional regulator